MRKANSSDKSIVLDILTRSFDDNRSVNFVVKQDRRRMDRIRGLMDYSFNMCHSFGEVWMSDNQQACALILFPDKRYSSLRTLFWDLKLALFVVGINKVGAVLKREAMIKANHPKEPIAYIWFIGVNPPFQSKGIGGTFISEIIRECEKKERSIYLETSMEKNLPFYKKFGFEIFQSVHFTYTLYMLRKA